MTTAPRSASVAICLLSARSNWLDSVQWLHNNTVVPTLHRLPNCKIEMRTRDHRPAHVHVLFSDGRDVLVYLDNLRAISRQPVRASEMAPALEWIAERTSELIARFEELQQ